MLNRKAYKIQNYIYLRRLSQINFCTERNLKSTNLKLVSSNVKHFFQDKNVLVTGATGFMGKCLVEKLLRSCPGIKNIYVLVRPKTGAEYEKRITELTNSQVFDRLRQENPKAIDKLIGLNGNIEEPDLGLNDRDFNKLIEKEPLVFHSAANIGLYPFEINHFRRLLRTNLGGTKNVLDLCHKMPNCKHLVYLSTLASNSDVQKEIKDRVYPTKHLPEQVLMAMDNDEKLKAIIDKVKNVFPTPYAYTKRLAENLLLNENKGLTVSIIRPSLVGTTWREPVKGWVDSPNSINVLAMLIAKGILRVWPWPPEAPMDIVPVDTTNNCIISSAWYTSKYKPNTVTVFSYNSGGINKLRCDEFRKMALETSNKYPFKDIFIYPNVNSAKWGIPFAVWSIFVHILPAFLADFQLRIAGKKPQYMKFQKAIQAAYSAIPNLNLTHDNALIFEMWDALSEEDKQEFCFDLRQIYWPAYVEDIILGLKTFYLKEDLSGLSDDRKRLQRKYRIYKFMKMIAITTALCSSMGTIYFLF